MSTSMNVTQIMLDFIDKYLESKKNQNYLELEKNHTFIDPFYLVTGFFISVILILIGIHWMLLYKYNDYRNIMKKIYQQSTTMCNMNNDKNLDENLNTILPRIIVIPSKSPHTSTLPCTSVIPSTRSNSASTAATPLLTRYDQEEISMVHHDVYQDNTSSSLSSRRNGLDLSNRWDSVHDFSFHSSSMDNYKCLAKDSCQDDQGQLPPRVGSTLDLNDNVNRNQSFSNHEYHATHFIKNYSGNSNNLFNEYEQSYQINQSNQSLQINQSNQSLQINQSNQSLQSIQSEELSAISIKRKESSLVSVSLSSLADQCFHDDQKSSFVLLCDYDDSDEIYQSSNESIHVPSNPCNSSQSLHSISNESIPFQPFSAAATMTLPQSPFSLVAVSRLGNWYTTKIYSSEYQRHFSNSALCNTTWYANQTCVLWDRNESEND